MPSRLRLFVLQKLSRERVWAAGIAQQLKASQQKVRELQDHRDALRRENDERREMIAWLLEKGFQFETGGHYYHEGQQGEVRLRFSEPICAEELRMQLKERREHHIGVRYTDYRRYERDAMELLPRHLAETLAAHVVAAIMQADGNPTGEARARAAVAAQKRRGRV